MRFSVGGIDSFLGFEYGDVITLASRVFRVLLTILPACLRIMRSALGPRWPSCLAPRPRCGCHYSVHIWGGGIDSFLGFDYGKVITLVSEDDYSADSSASLAQCSYGGGFFPNFAIFALVWGHLRNFSFYSWASLLVLPFLLRLPILLSLSLSPKVTSLGGFSCRPPSLVVPVFVFGGFSFCSSGAVSYSSSSFCG